MSTSSEVGEAILNKILAELENVRPNSGKLVRNLAETYAWVVAPDQPHGGAQSAD